MSLTQMLFSFEGRMRRRDFWLCGLLLCVAESVLSSVLSALWIPHFSLAMGPHGFTDYSYAYGWPFWRVSGLVWALTLWPWLAIGAKRCHDRGQTALWVAFAFVPVIGWLWWLVNLGFIDGTPGPNEYGPSPKGLGAAAVAPA
jgi:uncharacterized membrane protein YhaH (DUF805 family)